MKIVSGEFKYRKIEIPNNIRPTTEKVREAIFSILNNYIYEAIVLDLFAGSGSLGLESLSRGSRKCYFNEYNKGVLNILKKNINECKALGRSEVFNYDFKRCIKMLPEKLDIIFLDPPYKDGYNEGWYQDSFKLIEENNLAKNDTIIVAEHLEKYNLEEKYGSFVRLKIKKYGTIGVDIYKYQK